MKIFEVMDRRTFLKTAAAAALINLMKGGHIKKAIAGEKIAMFSPATQIEVLKKVLQLKNRKFDPNKSLPKVVSCSEVDSKIFLETWGFEVDTSKYQVNHYHWKRNLIIMADDSKIHNLAHEYVHYVQYAYEKENLAQEYGETLEMDAMTIQNYFR